MPFARIAGKFLKNKVILTPQLIILRTVFLLPALILLLSGCGQSEKVAPADPILFALSSEDPAIRRVMHNKDAHEIQILFTRISREGDSVLLQDYRYQVDDRQYFYPASTVKFPIAVLCLEALYATDSLDLDTRFFVEGDTVVTSFREDIRKMFAVSDNEANNRLVEFLGQDRINRMLKSKGVGPVRIAHRLGVHSDTLITKPLIIYLNDSTLAPTRPTLNTPATPLELEGLKKGNAHYQEDSLLRQPFDFSLKNYYPLETQHNVLKRVIFPEKYSPSQQFLISQSQREFLLDAMSLLPRQAGYEEAEYPDGYCKFFMFGDRTTRIPDHIRVYNKVGFAYGTLTDCAYIQDTKNGVEFLVSATILVNSDGVLNDDTYEYEEAGIPFLAALGRHLYLQELERK